MAKQQKKTASAMRFVDLFMILAYAFIFICSTLKFFGINTISANFLKTFELTFPIIVGGLLISIISIDDIVETKFPLSFKLSFRVALFIQVAWSLYEFYLNAKLSNAETLPNRSDILLINAPTLVWVTRTLFERIISIQRSLNTSKK